MAGHRSRRFVALAALAVLAPLDAHARRPQRREAWWSALGEPATSATAAGIHVLRTPRRGRVRIPGGTFTMGSTPTAMGRALELCEREIRAPQCHEESLMAMLRAEGIAHPVTISTFQLDRMETTVSEYAQCVSAGACEPSEGSPDGGHGVRPDLPITRVRWEDAVAFCEWAGGRLPTEAEWEYAARGVEGRQFPWGNVYNPHLANHGAWADDWTDATDGFVGLAPVGSFPDGATPLGVLDMAGNVAEWVADILELDGAGLPLPYRELPEVDPKPKAGGGIFHVVRGGSYADGAMWLRGAARDTSSSPRPPWVGFRCAAGVP